MFSPSVRHHLPGIAGLLVLGAAAADKVTFDDHVLPIFEQSCLNCHNPDKTKGGLDLSTYTAAMRGGSGGKIAEPGDSGSKLLAVVMQTSEPKMPPEGDKLAGGHIDTLRAWIEGGLLETQSSQARKPSKPKFDLSLKADPSARPDGPPPMPEHLLLDPPVVTPRASSVHAVACSPWAPLLAVTGQRQVLLHATDTLELAGILPFPEGDPVALAFTPNGRYLTVGGGIPGKSGTTVTFDVTNGERVLTAGKAFDTVLACDLRPGLDLLATGSPSRLVKLWRTGDGEQAASIKKHTDWVTALDFSPDGILLATGGRGGGVWVWEGASGNEFHTLRAHQAGITATAFRGDSNVLATASEDGTVRFWEMNNGREIRKLDAHPGGVLAFGWARDGSFATAGRDGKVKLWKPDFGHRRDLGGFDDLPTAVALDADGKRVFVGTYDGRVVAHEVESGARTGQFHANPPSIDSRLATLRERIRTHPQGVAGATATRDAAARERDRVLAAIAQAEAALDEARGAFADAGQRLNQARSEAKRAADEIGRTRQERDKLATGVDAQRKPLEEARAWRSEQTARLDSARREVEEAKGRLEAAENGADHPEHAARVAAARKTLTTRQQKRDGIADTLRQTGERIASLEADIEQRNQRRGELDRTLDALVATEKLRPETLRRAEEAVEAARKRVPEREQQLAERRKALPASQGALKQAEEKLNQVVARLERLRAQQRHWQAAELNARAIRTAKEAEAAASEAEGLASDFHGRQADFEACAEALDAKRDERRAVASSIDEQAEHAEELRAVLRSLEQVIADRAEELQRAEAAILELRRTLDERLPEAHRLRAETLRLEAEYRRMLDPSP